MHRLRTDSPRASGRDRVIFLEAPKTAALVSKLKELDMSGALIVTEEVDENLFLAARNVKGIDVRDVDSLDPVSLISYEKVLIAVPP